MKDPIDFSAVVCRYTDAQDPDRTVGLHLTQGILDEGERRKQSFACALTPAEAKMLAYQLLLHMAEQEVYK